MPALGERKTIGGVTGEWDGSTWRRVEDAPAPVVAEVAIGTRRTKDGVTGEWDGTTWRRIADTPENDMARVAAGAGGAAVAADVARPILHRVAESQGLANLIERIAGRGRFIPGVGTGVATAGSLAYGISKGEDPAKLALRAAGGAAAGYGTKLIKEGVKAGLRSLQPAAAAGANALGLELGAPALTTLGLSPEVASMGSTAPLSVPLAGGLAGVAGTAGFLAALQHDANRKVDIDYSKDTPDTWIARVLGGRSRDQRMDDPNDPMFQPDDQAVVTAKLLELLR